MNTHTETTPDLTAQARALLTSDVIPSAVRSLLRCGACDPVDGGGTEHGIMVSFGLVHRVRGSVPRWIGDTDGAVTIRWSFTPLGDELARILSETAQ